MKNRKNGVAVIIVLGLLALLMVLGVAFSVSMRVERAGAANYASIARTRQMVWAGLAKAIGDINQKTSGMYPDGDYLVSGASGWGTNVASGVRLLTGNARDHVPDLLLDLGYDTLRSRWLPLGGSGDDREGYIAYTVLNLSDMLDANHVGGAPREGGTNAAEVVLTGLGLSTADINTISAERNIDIFESLPDFRSRTGLSDADLVTYSRYLPDNNLTNAYFIGTTVAEIEAQDKDGGNARKVQRLLRELRNVFGEDFRPSSSDTALLFNYLLDYVDTEIEPRRLDGPNAKAVPLINEVAISTSPDPPRFRLQGATLQVDVPFVNIETWFPFFKPSARQFKVYWDQTATLQVGTNAPIVQTNSFSSTAYPLAGQAAGMTNQFYRHESTVPPSPNRFSASVTTNDSSFQVSIQINNMRVALASDDTVWVDAATNAVLAFNSDTVNIIHAGMPVQNLPLADPLTYQVSDPRLNWLASSWVGSDTPTMGAANPGQAGQRIHASNGGFLYSPLELGNLLMPRNFNPGPVWVAWDTLKVFETGGWRDPLLETFTTLPASGARRGIVNANTLYAETLEPAFLDMPFPNVGGPPTLPAAVQTNVTDMIIAARMIGTGFASLTDILDLDWQAALPALSEVEREAIAAYSFGLLGVRQNLFLIVVAASAGGEGMGTNDRGRVGFRGRQRALAVVWRDPVANSQGLYDCFIQHFQWLD